jgi:soluble lytic murein transglycosylase-like protein
MEKRHPRTLARTLSWAASALRWILVATLFIPVVLVMNYDSQPQADSEPVWIQEVQKPEPKELVKIYSTVRHHRPDISETEAWQLSELILDESSGYDLDPMLVLAVIDVESKFQYEAVSPAGARGIMQILPYVGKFLLQEIGWHYASELRPFRPEFLDDPVLNIKLGVYYLHDLRKNFRNLTHTLTAYNIGPTETKNRLDNDLELSDKYANAVLTIYYKHKKTPLHSF